MARQDFMTFENGNASIEVTKNDTDEFHVRMRMGAAYIVLYADTAELIDLRNKLTEFIQENGI